MSRNVNAGKGETKMKLRIVAATVLASVGLILLSVPFSANAATVRPRHECSTKYLRMAGAGVLLFASTYSPNCGGAALMAGDIYYAATKRFPRTLPERYVAHAHGTNTAGDRSAIFSC